MLRKIEFVFVAVFALLFFNSCQKSNCKKDTDCRVGMRCDASLGECVICLDNSHCRSSEFCCHGECKALSQVDEFCGCGPKLDQSIGSFCEEQYPLRERGVMGPMCLVQGNVPKDNVGASAAQCGCTPSDEEKCGDDGVSGLKNLCIGYQCVEQNAQHCGSSRAPCTADAGGTRCLPSTDGSKYGVCGCSSDDVVATCQAITSGHIVANRCVDNKCKCGEGPACRVDESKSDCCDGTCRDFLSDVGHCGACNHSCGNLRCFAGACECGDTRQCQTDATDLCALVDIPTKNGQPGFKGNLCVCSTFRESGAPDARNLPCAPGSFCCPVGGKEETVGCCSKPCDKATASDCKRVF